MIAAKVHLLKKPKLFRQTLCIVDKKTEHAHFFVLIFTVFVRIKKHLKPPPIPVFTVTPARRWPPGPRWGRRIPVPGVQQGTRCVPKGRPNFLEERVCFAFGTCQSRLLNVLFNLAKIDLAYQGTYFCGECWGKALGKVLLKQHTAE